MKKLLLSCFVLLLLAGCGNPPQGEYPDTSHTTESNDVPLWDDEKQTFINTIEGFSTEFIAYLRTLTPKDMPLQPFFLHFLQKLKVLSKSTP